MTVLEKPPVACFDTGCRIRKPISIARHQELAYCAVAEIEYLNYTKTEQNYLYIFSDVSWAGTAQSV